jgi:hypothetical protein
MPITHEDKTEKNAEGVDVRQYSVTFTNGSIEQLEELKSFFKLDNCLDVIKLGISFLQRLKDDEAKRKTPPSDSDLPQGKVNSEQ